MTLIGTKIAFHKTTSSHEKTTHLPTPAEINDWEMAKTVNWNNGKSRHKTSSLVGKSFVCSIPPPLESFFGQGINSAELDTFEGLTMTATKQVKPRVKLSINEGLIKRCWRIINLEPRNLVESCWGTPFAFDKGLVHLSEGFWVELGGFLAGSSRLRCVKTKEHIGEGFSAYQRFSLFRKLKLRDFLWQVFVLF